MMPEISINKKKFFTSYLSIAYLQLNKKKYL